VAGKPVNEGAEEVERMRSPAPTVPHSVDATASKGPEKMCLACRLVEERGECCDGAVRYGNAVLIRRYCQHELSCVVRAVDEEAASHLLDNI
tara:strand:- start:175 stop:450 length:276 start_codon:yes stop_codon:yes gene_type:complete